MFCLVSARMLGDSVTVLLKKTSYEMSCL